MYMYRKQSLDSLLCIGNKGVSRLHILNLGTLEDQDLFFKEENTNFQNEM